MRRWINDDAYLAEITSILKARDKADRESLTDVSYALEAFSKATVPENALTCRRLEILRRLALHATPSLITRTLLSWRLGLEDRILRKIAKRPDLKGIEELRWA